MTDMAEYTQEKGILRLHASHRRSLLQISATLMFLVIVLLLAWLFPPPPALKGIAGYLPLHTFLETIAIVIASLIFAVGWTSSKREVSATVVLLSCLFLGVALLDFSHVLSFKGMPDFVTPSDPEKAINFWLTARLLAASGLLAAAVIPWRLKYPALFRPVLLTGTLLLTLAVYMVLLFYPEYLPRTFINKVGLTAFKVYAEYFLIALNLLTALLFLLRMRKPQSYHAAALFGTACVMAMSEFYFTLYADVTDIFNLLGHVYKVIAYLFLYRALFVETVDNPYLRLQNVQKSLEMSIQASGIGLWDWNVKTNEVYLSPEWKAQIGYADNELPSDFTSWETHLHPEDHDSCMKVLHEFISGTRLSYQSEFRLRHKRGDYRWIIARGEKQLDEKGEVMHLRGSHIDITERKTAENEIHQLAYFDALTGLPNRRMLMDRFNQALLLSDNNRLYGALLFLDLDHFKNINDTLGHVKGDLLLVESARRIGNSLRKGDILARLGGDEFIVMIENTGTDIATASRVAASVAEKIRLALSTPFTIDDHQHHSSVSIGIALFYGMQESADDLLKHADAAMYQAKNSGRNSVRFYDPDMQQKLEDHASLETDLRSAIALNQLQLYYQVQVNRDGQPVGAEALIRWMHPKRGMIPPLDFISIAEESSLILDIGEWVMQQACRQLSIWSRDPATRKLNLAINVSAAQFQTDNFIETLNSLIELHACNPEQLKLELTESTVLHNIEEVIQKMLAVRKIGVRLSLDDFGTGYSSLSYLTRLPINQIKIDQSFVRNILLNRNHAIMAQTIIQMTHNFGLDVIAEGVETPEQAEFLMVNGCQKFQGYLFSKPIPAEAFMQLMQGWKTREHVPGSR